MANIIEITDRYPLSSKTIKIGKSQVTIKTYLNADDFVAAVHTMADTCFTEEGYRPEYLDIVKPYVVLKYLTDIDLGEMSVEEVFKVCQNSWYGIIERECFDCSILNIVEAAANKLIDYRLSIQKSSFDEMCDKVKQMLNNMPNNIEDKLDDVKNILDGLNNVDKTAFVEEAINQNLEKNKEQTVGE